MTMIVVDENNKPLNCARCGKPASGFRAVFNSFVPVCEEHSPYSMKRFCDGNEAYERELKLKGVIASALADMDAELRDHPNDPECLHPVADRAAWEVLEIVAPEINRKREEMDNRCKGFWYA